MFMTAVRCSDTVPAAPRTGVTRQNWYVTVTVAVPAPLSMTTETLEACSGGERLDPVAIAAFVAAPDGPGEADVADVPDAYMTPAKALSWRVCVTL